MTALTDAAPAAVEPTKRRGLLGSSWTRLLGLVVALGALFLVVLASLAFGSKSVPIASVFDAFLHFDGSNDHLIVRSLRVPRTVVGVAVGAGLGLSGAVMQGVTRNPLADPGILGVEAGASLAVVMAIRFLDITSLGSFVWFGFLGAGIASVVVYGLGSMGRGGATPVKLALAGAAMAAMLASLTSAILLLDLQTLDAFRFWVVGSLAGRDADIAREVVPFMVVGAVLALGSARSLNALALGDDVARSLGMRVGVARGVSALAVVILSGAAVAAAGPIGFIGLTIPHVARAITGPDYRWVLPWSMVLGPILLLGSDVVGRLVARPGELQVGLVTAVIGAPFFIALVRRRKLAEL
ncbi:iron chelate uptake ABC transporter family permease subunit [Aquihabitans sp. G128]|uniref:FecCD family ABC transporter permease n=1 Tax=Aquihabitans sp. G128 TaxID=2849779 RepID=UPI001C216DCC|nr:iron chelate uptake ABC transporter family permease subunit [Aquihabitans sp. G128]QXC63333.1 iron chelate uptake ABC transporter family permease subunit [Aquihabitans sp. G128]